MNNLIKIAAPIALIQLIQGIMASIDIAMAGRYSNEALAAVSFANSLWIPLLMLCNGVFMVVNSKFARFYGSNRLKSFGIWFHQALIVAIILGFLSVFILILSPFYLPYFTSKELADYTFQYIVGFLFYLPLCNLYQVLKGIFESQGNAKISLYISIMLLPFNILFNYLFVYIINLGVFGFGLGSTLSILIACILLFYILMQAKHKEFNLFGRFKINYKLVIYLFKVGLPSGIALFVETSVFSLIALFLGKEAVEVISASQISLTISTLAFMSIYALSISTTIVVSQNIGAKKFNQAKSTVYISLVLALMLSCFNIFVMLNFESYILSFYTNDHHVIEISSKLIIFICCFQVFDAMQLIFAGALRGYLDTKIIMKYTFISYYLISIPIGFISFPYFTKPYNFWFGLILGLLVASLLFAYRYFTKTLKSI